MTNSDRCAAVAICAVCVLLGMSSWAAYIAMLRPAPGLDWMVYFTAARVYLDGNLPIILDPLRFTMTLNDRFSGWLAHPLGLHPWVYPPHFLLLFLPFGLLAPVPSYALFVLTTLLGLLVTIRVWLHATNAFWLQCISLMLSPAAALGVMVGQNAFLAASLLIGGFALMTSAPILSGALLGVLSFKPQLCIMVPVALIAGRQWKTLVSMTLTAAVLGALSLALFGPGIWRGWFLLMAGQSDWYTEWQSEGRLWGMSVFACAVALGSSFDLARILQMAAVLIAGGGVFLAFRSAMSAGLRLAVLLTGTFLAAPHVSNYDAVLLTIAATLLFQLATEARLSATDLIVAALVWLCPIANPPLLHSIGAFTPALTCIFLSRLLIRGMKHSRGALGDRLEPDLATRSVN
jgi:alpha-1,2-mannosyltransferase